MPRVQRSGGGAAAQAATVGDGLLLSARQVPHRGKLGTIVRPHGRVQREVSVAGTGLLFLFPIFLSPLLLLFARFATKQQPKNHSHYVVMRAIGKTTATAVQDTRAYHGLRGEIGCTTFGAPAFLRWCHCAPYNRLLASIVRCCTPARVICRTADQLCCVQSDPYCP